MVAPEAQKGVRQEELEKVLAEQKRNADLTVRLKAELDAIGEDRRKLNAMLIGSAATIRDLETRQAAAEARLGSLQTSEDTVRRSLGSRRAVIAEVLAALQRVGRKPPPALLVSPGGCPAIGADCDPAWRRAAGHEDRSRHAAGRSRRTGKTT